MILPKPLVWEDYSDLIDKKIVTATLATKANIIGDLFALYISIYHSNSIL